MKVKEKKRAIIFVAILILFFAYLLRVFDLEERERTSSFFDAFYAEKENTMDAVYFGTSAANRYWIPTEAYEKHGMTVYGLSTASQPMVLIKYLIKEVEKTQDPRLYIIELRSSIQKPDGFNEVFIRRVTDNMKMSQNRIDAINASLDFAAKGINKVTQERASYYFPFLKYHARWDGDMDFFDFTAIETRTRYKGFWTSSKKTMQIWPQPEVERTDKSGCMDDATEEVFLDLLEFCDGLSADVLFVVSPYYPDMTQQVMINDAAETVKQAGYPVLEMNTSEKMKEIGLDGEKDFYNSTHVNWSGALKYTGYLSDYINKNYDLKDRRNDSRYKSWDKAEEALDEKISKIEIKEKEKEEKRAKMEEDGKEIKDYILLLFTEE